MPCNFSSSDGLEITAKCSCYLKPLIQGEDCPADVDGLAKYVSLKNVAVAKKLPEFKR